MAVIAPDDSGATAFVIDLKNMLQVAAADPVTG